jgi:hypothetical protein
VQIYTIPAKGRRLKATGLNSNSPFEEPALSGAKGGKGDVRIRQKEKDIQRLMELLL